MYSLIVPCFRDYSPRICTLYQVAKIHPTLLPKQKKKKEKSQYNPHNISIQVIKKKKQLVIPNQNKSISQSNTKSNNGDIYKV